MVAIDGIGPPVDKNMYQLLILAVVEQSSWFGNGPHRISICMPLHEAPADLVGVLKVLGEVSWPLLPIV
jgi:hypothetical protein